MDKYDNAFGQVEQKLRQSIGAENTEKLKGFLADEKSLEQVTSRMNQKQKSMLEYVLQNPDALQALVSSPQAAVFLKKLAEGKIQ